MSIPLEVSFFHVIHVRIIHFSENLDSDLGVRKLKRYSIEIAASFVLC